MKGIIDRFEGEYALVELDGREMLEIKKELLPGNAKEGDVLILTGDKYIIDQEETNKRKEKIKNLNHDLWE